MKHFPVQRSAAAVARTHRLVRVAKTTGKFFTERELQTHKLARSVLNRKQGRGMTSESLLGKSRAQHAEYASHVYKMLYGGEMTSTATIVCDKVVVPLHSHVEGREASISNAVASAILRGEIIPIAEDLGVFFHGGAVKPMKGWRMEIPVSGIAMQIGYKSDDEVEPTHGVGFYSASGLYDAPTEAGNCGGPVISVANGALIGFHIAGSDSVNRFVPLTALMIEKLKATQPVLQSMLFQ